MSHGELLRMYRGDTQVFVAEVVDDYGPLDVTGYEIRWTAKHRYQDEDTDAVIVKTTGYDGGITLGVGIGEVIITLDPEDTEDLEKNTRLVWDLQLTDIFGAVKTPEAGALLVQADISRTTP